MSPTVRISIVADARAAVRGLNDTTRAAQNASGHLGKMGTAVGVLGGNLATAGIGAVVSGITDAVKGSIEGAKVVKTLNNQINNLGASGKAAFAGASDYADTFGASIGQDDDAVRGAVSKLASFPDAFKEGSLGAEGMKRSIASAFDLQAIGIGDAQSNIVGIGKAMNDPIKGMSALAKSGVSFTGAQQEQIKNYVKQGKLAAAQKVLLSGIESNAKGAALANADPLSKLKVTFDQLIGDLTDKLLPKINAFADVLAKNLPPILDKIKTGFSVLWAVVSNPAFQALAIVVGTLAIAFGIYSATVAVVTAVTGAWATVTGILNGVLLLNPIGLVVVAIVLLVAAFVIAYKKSETFRAIVTTTLHLVAAAFTFLWDQAKAAFEGVKAGFTIVNTFIVGKVAELVGYFTGIGSRISKATSGMWDGVKNAFRSMLNWVIRKWNDFSIGIPSIDTHIPGVGSIGGFTLNTPNLPLLASGGYIASTGIAVVHRGETVVPKGAGGPPTVINIYVDVPVSADRAATGEAVVSAIQAYERRIGHRLLSA